MAATHGSADERATLLGYLEAHLILSQDRDMVGA
jgi:hypothetical protein